MATRQECPKWVYDRRKETRNKDGILHESEPFCDSGMMPSSVVLREWEHDQYVTHVKIYADEHTKPSYAWGHYYTDLTEAAEDYKKRCKDYDVKIKMEGE